MVEKSLPGCAEQIGKFGPGIRAAHVDDADSFDSGLGWLEAKEARGLTAFDTAPEFAFSGDNEVLVERIGMSGDLYLFAASSDHREHRRPGRYHPHVVLQLRHVF